MFSQIVKEELLLNWYICMIEAEGTPLRPYRVYTVQFIKVCLYERSNLSNCFT